MIVTTRDGGRRQARVANLTPFMIDQIGVPNAANVVVSPTTISGIPAYNRAVRIAAEAVASLRMKVWRGEGLQRRAVDTVWQAKLFKDALNPCQSRFNFWEMTETSLSKRGNAYWWVNSDPTTKRATEIYALHPDQVMPVYTTGGIEYNVVVASQFVDPTGQGFGFYTKDESTILHIRSFDSYGLISPSPVQVYRESLGVRVAQLKYEGNVYGRGAALRGVVTLPAGTDKKAADEWRDMWRSTYESGGETTGILGGGATFSPVSMSMADAQFIESQQFGIAECARIVGITATLLDEGGTRSPSTPLSPEHEQMRWFRYGLNPRLERIESAMTNYPVLFPPQSSVYPAFDSENFIRGDLITEDAIAHQRIQDGRLTPDEWREANGLPPHPDGLGAIPQVVPVGGGANPDVPAPAAGAGANPDSPEPVEPSPPAAD